MKIATTSQLATTALAIGLALLWTTDAFAAKRKYRERTDTYRYDTPRYRSNTVAPNGNCQRDTGTHNSNLSFRNKCDVEEFWERMNRNGRRG